MGKGPDPLFARAIWCFLPPAAGPAVAQFRGCLGALCDQLAEEGLADRDILRLSFFLDATTVRGYASLKSMLGRALKETFGPLPPPASFIAQPPEGGRRVALEAEVLAARLPGLTVRRRSLGGVTYAVVEGPGFREVHGAGLASDGRSGDMTARAKRAFERMAAVLRKEGLTFGHVVRQWNYIEDIVGLRTVRGKRCQNYQAFNDVRTLSYGRSGFPTGYPAATGIGQAAGGVILEFMALAGPGDVKIVPLSNPRQVDAHRYSGGVLVGSPIEEMPEKTSPKFERAKLMARERSGLVYVSGTAAVLGQRSVGRGDVEGQTRTTARNIAALVDHLSYLRAYVKRASDIPKVRRVCERAFGPIPALYVRADVCRDELLVELEGVKVIWPT
jgi:enamine deaminase RidA (YjgF/YER057c/UK114 family)